MADVERVLPADIERRSMEIIDAELASRGIVLDVRNAAVVKRVIHTSADFDYAGNLRFSPGAVDAGVTALKAGATILTDTNMARAGVSKPALAKLGGDVVCYMADENVARTAREQGTTRAVASMEKAARTLDAPVVAIGNAPTALIHLVELIDAGAIAPRLVIGVPVGFVNVEASKELMMERADVPWIVARGRKGGSNIAAAICNALLYEATGRQL
ncbi:MAG: precorrin-8X methylmutase [Coriobacteriales bacterium]|jgi:precorrin-8X/cobalt-precorrin-8 methylmutase